MYEYFLPLIIKIHSWYPAECCSDQDCFPIVCNDIVEKTDNTYVWNNIIFLKDQVKPSLDGLCHACVTTADKGLCLFIQMNT